MSVDNLSVQDFLTALNLNYEKDRDQAPPESAFPYGNRVSMIAPPGAGKTATVAGLFHRAQIKVRDTLHTDAPFFCRTLEHGSNIHQDIADLMDGYFPAKTQTYLGFRSSPGLLLEQKKFATAWKVRKQLWHKMLQLHIGDLPGETLAQVMWQVRRQVGPQAAITRKAIETAITEMRESEAYIFILKASLAKGLGVQLEKERDPLVSQDPDVNLVRMLEDIANYKMKHGKKIKAAYVVIAAWDKLAPMGERLGFDLLNPNLVERQADLENFVGHCFSQFFATLHSSRIPLVQYYPTFFQTETNDKQEEILFEDEVPYKDGTGVLGVKKVQRPHIMTKELDDPEATSIWQNVRAINYSEKTFDKLLDDVMKLAVAK